MEDPRSLTWLGLIIDGDAFGFTWYTKKNLRKIAYPISPPRKPPSILQQIQRQRFAAAVAAFMRLDVVQRELWEEATARLSICSTGIGLWISLCLSPGLEGATTIIRQSGLPLTPPPRL